MQSQRLLSRASLNRPQAPVGRSIKCRLGVVSKNRYMSRVASRTNGASESWHVLHCTRYVVVRTIVVASKATTTETFKPLACDPSSYG